MQPVFEAPATSPKTSLSVIIPARNEAENIGRCIDSILAQNYPSHLLEFIVVDDHSTDNTAKIIKSYAGRGVKYINLADYVHPGNTSYKKQALATAISQSKGELIVTTDADCTAGPEWLKLLTSKFEEEDCVMIVAPVDFTNNTSLVEVFQSLDFMSMQGITVATLRLKLGNMSNGANLAFSRKAFDAVDGYKGIDHIASGDDYLLMTKFDKSYPGRISYLKSKDAIVRTPPQHDWSGFFQQRIRWASKSGKYDDNKLTGVLMLVYLFNVSFLTLAIAGIFHSCYWLVLLGILLVKTIVEIIYLYPVSRFFGKRKQLWVFPLLQPLHILYIISAGFLGFVGVYQWKGRSVK